MKFRKLYILCLWLGLFQFTACDNNDSETEVTNPLYLSALVDGMQESEAAYRFQGGQGVGLWLSSQEVAGQLKNADIATNCCFVQSAGGLVSEPRTYLNGQDNLVVYGYYPYSSEAKNNPEAYLFSVELNQDSCGRYPDGNRASDLLWTKYSGNYTATPINLAFHHLMCKVVLHVRSDSDTPGSFLGAEVFIKNTQTQAEVDLGAGKLAPTGEPADIVSAEVLGVPQGYEIAREAIVVPQLVESGKPFLEIRTLGNYSYSWSGDKNLVLEGGKQIVLDVLIKEGECSITIKEISDWKDSGNLVIGEAIESAPTYKLFDFYNQKGIQGIVVNVDETGQHGWLVSLDEKKLEWCTEPMGTLWPASESKTDAAANLKGVLAVDPTLKAFPAMKWCNDKNKDGIMGWIMPASNTLEMFTEVLFKENAQQTVERFNEAIRNCPVDASLKSEIKINWNDWFAQNFYLSSTLSPTGRVRVGGFYYGGFNTSTESQNIPYRVRAFHKF